MKLLTAADIPALSIVDRVRFSYRKSLIGFFVVFLYGAGIVWFMMNEDLPIFILVANVLLWVFFFWYWQRNLRRLLGGARPYSIATTSREVVFPINDIDKDVPPELDLFVVVDAVEIDRTELVDLRTIVRYEHAGRVTVSKRRTPLVRLVLRDAVPEALNEAIRAVQGERGFQILHVNVPAADVLEVFVGIRQLGAVEKMLSALTLRLKPARLVHTEDLRNGGDEADFDRLRSAGEGIIARRAQLTLEAKRGQD